MSSDAEGCVGLVLAILLLAAGLFIGLGGLTKHCRAHADAPVCTFIYGDPRE